MFMSLKEYKHQWYLKNKEVHNEQTHKYYQDNKDKMVAQQKIRYENNKEQILASQKEYYLKNKDKVTQSNLRYVETHREQISAYKHRWYLENKKTCIARARVSKAKRRMKIYENGGSFTAREWLELCETFDNQCVCCGNQGELTVDHIVPISKGGRNDIQNIQPLCLRCNLVKGTKTINYIDILLVDL